MRHLRSKNNSLILLKTRESINLKRTEVWHKCMELNEVCSETSEIFFLFVCLSKHNYNTQLQQTILETFFTEGM